MNNPVQFPESQMMGFGYAPEDNQGAAKTPIYQTSTFVFSSAEEGKAFFELAYEQRAQRPGEHFGHIYSRITNPNAELFEKRICLWEGAEEAAVFNSGMSAISTVMLAFLKPGDVLLYSNPIYGGTHHFIHHVLTGLGIHCIGFGMGKTYAEIEAELVQSQQAHKLAMIYLETPANPTNQLVDITQCARLARRLSRSDKKILTVVDNTYMGPLWLHPQQHGADLSVYSATKYIGGHSDVLAGAVTGSSELVHKVKSLRTFLGNMAPPFTAWLLLRSLETLKLRMDKQAENAERVRVYLENHPLVEKVYYPGHPGHANAEQEAIYRQQYRGRGAMLSFDIRGGEEQAFTFLNNLKLVCLAVSLGGTESLAEHPATMTHADVPLNEKKQYGISPKMIRLSVGVENSNDLLADLEQALAKVNVPGYVTAAV